MPVSLTANLQYRILAPVVGHPDRQPNLAALGEFDRVVQKVDKNLLQSQAIGGDG